MIDGIPLISDPRLVVCVGTERRWRTWREVFFTQPWKPWRLKKLVAKYIPDPHLYHINGVGFVGHPETICRIKEMSREFNKEKQ